MINNLKTKRVKKFIKYLNNKLIKKAITINHLQQ